MKAFVFSSAGDRPAAAACHRHLAGLGVASVVALDAGETSGALAPWEILTDFPRGPRITGSACAIGIAELMAREPDGVVAKVDADNWLSAAGVAWLSTATERAHGHWIGKKHRWAGCWAAPAAAMADVAAVLRTLPPCDGCGEANLMHWAFKSTCGIRRALPPTVQVWRAGRAIQPAAHVVMLPSGVPAAARAADLAALFAHSPVP